MIEDEPTGYDDLMDFLFAGEYVEGIVLGPWSGYLGLSEDKGVPVEKQGKIFTLKEAEPFMKDWRFIGGFGGADCNAVYIWTNMRCIGVHEYDGSTCLSSIPRFPSVSIPEYI